MVVNTCVLIGLLGGILYRLAGIVSLVAMRRGAIYCNLVHAADTCL